MPEQWFALIIVGLVAGVAAGMFGIGGGVIIVPALTVLIGFGLKTAVGTSLAALLMPVSIFAVLAYYRAGKLKIATAAWVAFGLLFGAIVGAQIALGLDGRVLQQLYGIFLLYMAWRFTEPRTWWAEWRGQKAPQAASETVIEAAWYILLGVGLGAGVLAGMFGIGGGVIIVPALVTLLKFDQKQAVGTSLAALLPPVSLGAVISYYNEGLLDIAVAACVAAGLVGGSVIGARIALGLSSSTVKRLYGLFLLFVGLRFILQF
ncbi:MAG: sulfite exporter TauE/SafE family protein [Anaerolineae bacterium]|nr:sulfite exporter TauE/SafE family protein [Anaerolineae bacterium]